MRKIISKNPLFFSFFLPAITDATVTLLGQNKNYWSNYVLANEASPIYYFLAISPWLYIFGVVIWFVFWYWLFLRLKTPINLFLMFSFISGHSWGVASWIFKLLKDWGFYLPTNQLSVIYAWVIVVLYFWLISFSATYCLNIYLEKNKFEIFKARSLKEIKKGLNATGKYNQKFINSVVKGLKQSSFYRDKTIKG